MAFLTSILYTQRELQRQFEEEDNDVPDLISVSDNEPHYAEDPSVALGLSFESKVPDRSCLHRTDSIADESSEVFRVYHFNGLEVC